MVAMGVAVSLLGFWDRWYHRCVFDLLMFGRKLRTRGVASFHFKGICNRMRSLKNGANPI
jgi:hypothetical protein